MRQAHLCRCLVDIGDAKNEFHRIGAVSPAGPRLVDPDFRRVLGPGFKIQRHAFTQMDFAPAAGQGFRGELEPAVSAKRAKRIVVGHLVTVRIADEQVGEFRQRGVLGNGQRHHAAVSRAMDRAAVNGDRRDLKAGRALIDVIDGKLQRHDRLQPPSGRERAGDFGDGGNPDRDCRRGLMVQRRAGLQPELVAVTNLKPVLLAAKLVAERGTKKGLDPRLQELDEDAIPLAVGFVRVGRQAGCRTAIGADEFGRLKDVGHIDPDLLRGGAGRRRSVRRGGSGRHGEVEGPRRFIVKALPLPQKDFACGLINAEPVAMRAGDLVAHRIAVAVLCPDCADGDVAGDRVLLVNVEGARAGREGYRLGNVTDGQGYRLDDPVGCAVAVVIGGDKVEIDAAIRPRRLVIEWRPAAGVNGKSALQTSGDIEHAGMLTRKLNRGAPVYVGNMPVRIIQRDGHQRNAVIDILRDDVIGLIDLQARIFHDIIHRQRDGSGAHRL